MHTIRLWEPSPRKGPDGWHRMAAPGGYEGWWFDADDPNSSLRVTVAIFIGDIFSRTYLDAYRQFRRRPTRFAPPRPADHCAVYVSAIEKGRPAWQQVFRPPSGAFQVIEAKRQFELKEVANWRFGETETTLQIGSNDGPTNGLVLNVARASRPCICPGSTGETPVPQAGRDFHRWIVTSSRSGMDGVVRIPTDDDSISRKIEFQGWGVEGHCVGTAPPIDRLGRPVIGSDVLKDHACLFRLSGATWV